MNTFPLLTIVTVCYNAKTTIEDTILSVINQTYPNIEYIIIDGGSTDGTIDLIKKYSNNISYWKSEPDKGIYDAMNKGIEIANGHWINFMNSGDTFYDNEVLLNLFIKKNIWNSDIIYGNRIITFYKKNYFQRPSSLDNFNNYFPIFHQSTFVRTSLMKIQKYDLRFKICSDYHFFYTQWKNHKKFDYVNITISVCDCELGVSSQIENEFNRTKENFIIQEKKNHVNLFMVYVKSQIKKLLNKFIPSLVQKYRINNIIKALEVYEYED